METLTPKYKRVLLKLSGEALQEEEKKDEKQKAVKEDEKDKKRLDVLDFEFIARIAEVIKKCVDSGVQIGVIVGAGNIWRGRKGSNMNRVRADSMGMLATTINALALQDAFIAAGIDTKVMTAVEMQTFADRYTTRDAVKALEEGKVVIFGCGTGSPYFSTDTAAVLRAAEIEADVVLMAKNVDGIYNADPNKVKNAVRYDELTYKEILDKGLKALDLSAATFCLENDLDSYAFGLADPMNIYRVLMGEKVGTEIHK